MNKSYEKSMAHCDDWDRMYKKYGPEKLMKKIMRLKSYRDYMSRWPHDFKLTPVPIDEYEPVSKDPSLEEQINDKLELEKFESSLTDHQRQVFQLLKEGKTNSEIEEILGFNTNSAVRFQKHSLKQKIQEVYPSHLNEYVCRSCAFIYKDKTPLDCPKCGSRDVLNTTVDW